MDERSTPRHPTRRHLLTALGLGMIGSAAGAFPRIERGRLQRLPRRDLQHGGIADWAALVGQRFDLAPGMGGALTLVEVEPMSSGGRKPQAATRGRNFAATFEADAANPPAGDQTYFLSPRSAPALPLYLGSPATVAGKLRLVAIFN